MKGGAGRNREEALERRGEYIRLRLEGVPKVKAGAALDLTVAVRNRYERWAQVALTQAAAAAEVAAEEVPCP